MTREEHRQLLALAETLEAFAATPHMVLHLAAGLRALVVGAPVRACTDGAPVQLELAPGADCAAHLGSPQHNPQRSDGTSDTYDAAPPAPSSSSDLKISDQEKKKTVHAESCRPHTDDPLPDDFRAVYDRVVAERAERGEKIPSAPFLWANFVEFLWDENKSYSRRSSLKRRWREWVVTEKAIVQEAAASSPAVAERKPPRRAVEAPPAPSEPRPLVPAVDPDLGALLGAGLRLVLTSDPGELVAEGKTGPPRAVACA